MDIEIKPDVESILKKFPPGRRESLISILQEVQEAQGYLSREAVAKISRYLKLPASKIYGVGTFYDQFRFKPLGKYHLQVCRGTACHVNSSLRLLDGIQRVLKIQPGDTTKDGMFSLESVSCLGACGLGPVICVNGEFIARVSPEKIGELLDGYRRKAMQHD